ncbi:MAG TPA: hypothetical protein GXZ90_05110 [Clostridiales bacterium]|nr:hypothetical protein [Clostridiales bacterium]
MDYEDRLIIYIDVLGFSDFVNYTTISKVNQKLKIEQINKFLTMISEFFDDKNSSLRLSKTKEVTSFSDLIIVSIKLDEIDNLDLEIMDVFYLLLNATFKGFLLRGSIVYGKIIHTKNVVFGSGLIEAYSREKKLAKYPRIIIDKAIVKDLKELSLNNPVSSLDDIIKYDVDGLLYIDMFKEMRNHSDNFWQYTQILKSLTGILLNMIGNPILYEKYNWLIEKFVAEIEENSEALNYSFGDKVITQFDLEVFHLYLSDFSKDDFKKMK